MEKKNDELVLSSIDRWVCGLMLSGFAVGAFGLGALCGIWWTLSWAR